MSSSKRGRLSGGRGRSSTSHTAQGPPHLIPNPNEPAPQLSRPLYQQQLSQLYSGYSVRAPPPFFVPMTQLPPIYPPPNLSQLPHLQTYGAARYPPPGPGVTRPSDANRPRSSSAPVAMPGSHPLNWYQMIYCPFATPALSTNPMDHVLRQQYPVASYNPLEGYIARQLQSPALGSESCSVSPRDVESPPPPPYNPMLGRLQEHATAQHIFRLANPNSHMPPNFDDVTMQRKVSIWEVDENDESSMFTSNDHPRICPAKLPIQEDFNQRQFKQIEAIIRRNDLKESTEDIFYAVAHWIAAGHNRRQHMRELLLQVRLIFLPIEFLENVVMRHPFVKNDSLCRAEVLNAIKYRKLLQPERSAIRCTRTFPSSWQEPDTRVFDEELCEKRISFDPPKRIYVFGGNSDDWRGGTSARTKTFEFYDCRDETWNMGGDMPVMSDSFAATSYRNTIWIVGGEEVAGEGENIVTRVTDAAYFYTPSRDLWSNAPPMKKRRSNLGLIEYNGCLYAIGGKGETDAYEKSVEVITTPNQLSWKDGVDMNTGRADMGVAAVRSRIYVVGGVKESDKSRMEYFCSVTQQWTYVDIEVPHRDFRGVAVDDELVYLIGGDDVTTYNVYNPACSRKGWKQLPGANTADVVCLWKRSAIAAVDSVIYCIGGAFQGQRMATVSSYSTVTGIWNHACSTCTSKRANAKAVVLKMC